MKRLIIFIMLLNINMLIAMKRKAEEIEPAKEVTSIASTEAPFETLPNEIKKQILEYLITTHGATKRARLDNAAENIRNFTRVSKAFRPFAFDQEIINYIITELANRYANGDKIEAAIALGTEGAAQWLAEVIKKQWTYKHAHLTNEKYIDAAKNGRVNVMDFLYHAFPTFQFEFSQALHAAVKNGQLNTATKILDNPSTSTHVIEFRDEFGATILMVAALEGYEAIVDKLLSKNANVWVYDNERDTPLLAAVISKNPNVVSKILARMQYRNPVWTPGQIQVIQKKYNEIINARESNDGQTPLTIAVSDSQVDIVRMLLDAGVNPNVANGDDDSALTIAKSLKTPQKDILIKLLEEKGAR